MLANYSRPSSFNMDRREESLGSNDGTLPWRVSLKSVPSKNASATQVLKTAPSDQRQLQHAVLSENLVSQNSTIVIPETKSVKDLVRRFQKD